MSTKPVATNPLNQNVTPAHMRRWLWGGMAVCVVLWLAIPMAFKIGFGVEGFPTSLNEIGDSFGSVSALFSALTMAGVIYSLLLQRADISQTLVELQGSRKAQSEIAVLEKENLAARMVLADKHETRNAAMTALFKEQAEALHKQIEILQAQGNANAVRQFQTKFDRRFDRWQAVRETLGDGARYGQDYVLAAVQWSAKDKSFTCPKLNPDDPSSLPYDFLGSSYMRNFKSLVLMFNDPQFASLAPDEREDFALELRNELTEAERLVLMHLFAGSKKAAVVLDEPVAPRPNPLRLALARADALGGLQKVAECCLGDAAKTYRAQVVAESLGAV